jgi:aryl-alcohol dehydrogenase-like predicted oxidoreductase
LDSDSNTRRLGSSNILISPLGLGVWQFANKGGGLAGGYWPEIPFESMVRIVNISLEGGINWFDTAQVYGNGNSERNLVRSLRENGREPGDVVIATKWWPLLKTAANIRKTIGDRIRFLEGFPIDLYQVHQPFSISSIKAQMNAMTDLVDKGKIKCIGVSNFSNSQMIKAHEALESRGLKLLSNQVHYNLIRRKIERNGVMESAKELGITIIAYSPLEQGILTGKFHRNPALLNRVGFIRKRMFSFGKGKMEKSRPIIDAIQEIAEVHEATSSQVALSWLINYHGDTVVTIPGASKPKHAQENVGTLKLALSRNEMDQLEEMTRDYL